MIYALPHIKQIYIFIIFLTAELYLSGVRNMEKKLSLNWYIYNNEASFEERYCHN